MVKKLQETMKGCRDPKQMKRMMMAQIKMFHRDFEKYDIPSATTTEDAAPAATRFLKKGIKIYFLTKKIPVLSPRKKKIPLSRMSCRVSKILSKKWTIFPSRSMNGRRKEKRKRRMNKILFFHIFSNHSHEQVEKFCQTLVSNRIAKICSNIIQYKTVIC